MLLNKGYSNNALPEASLAMAKSSNQVLAAARTIQGEKNQLKQIIDVLEADKNNNWKELRAQMPENEEEILKFLDQAQLEDQPTEVLI